MTPNTPAQIRKEEARKSRRADERFRRWLEGLRRRQMQQQERNRRRRWLLTLLLALLESKPMQIVYPSPDPAPRPAPANRPPARKSEKKLPDADTRNDDERRYLYDYAPRHGEESQEIYDGLTWNDIIAYNQIHRPWLFPKFEPISGMPKRYADEPVHIWTLFDHLDSDYHRPEAIKALKLIVDAEAHDWIDACKAETNGLTWKDLRRQCRRRTPDQTLSEFPRAAERWREELRREAEEAKSEVKETPDSGPKPSGRD